MRSSLRLCAEIIIVLWALTAMISISLETDEYEYPVKDNCLCKPKFSGSSKGFIVCFENCHIKPVTSHLYNTTCAIMLDITIVKCKGENYIFSKPVSESSDYHSWFVLFNYLFKLIIILSTWIVMSFSKTLIFALLSSVHYLSGKIFKTKICKTCQNSYLFTHIDCPKPSFLSRTDFHISYYILLVVMLFFVSVKADDNIYNQYTHGSYTEIQILDKEHYSQDFKSDGFLHNFYVENSHLVFELINISVITRPIRDNVSTVTWSCDGNRGCRREHISQYNSEPTFYVKKAFDGFSCAFTTATICGTCASEHVVVGTHVRVTKVSPYIDIRHTSSNLTELLTIREFGKYIHDPYYIKPIAETHLDIKDYLVSGSSVFQAMFCERPEINCFGPNYIIGGNHIKLTIPKVVDTMGHDREVEVQQCDYKFGSDISSLTKTDMVYSDGKIFSPYSFGMLSIGIPKRGDLVGEFCAIEADVVRIVAEGCYDCQHGLTIIVDYSKPEACRTLQCEFHNHLESFFVDKHTTQIKFHAYCDTETLDITCNKKKTQIKLDKFSESSVTFTNNAVKGTAEQKADLNFLKRLLLNDYKKLLFSIVIFLVTIYFLLRTPKMILKYILKLFKHYKDGRNKKSDDLDNGVVISMLKPDC